jgi:proline iminopeptidase
LFGCQQHPENSTVSGYFKNDTPGLKTGGAQVVQIETMGKKFNVWTKSFGNSPTMKLLLLSGGPGTSHEYFECMESFLPAEGIELIYYDQLGTGFSDNPDDTAFWDLDRYVEEVEQVRKALGLNKNNCYLLGHSWGGGIAMLAAAQESAAATGGVRKLVLVNAVGATSDWLPPLHTAGLARLTGDARARLAACDVRQLERPELGVHADYAQAFFPAWFADAALARSVAPPRGDSVTGAHVAARLRRDGYDWIDRLRDLPVPTLVLHGAADVLPLSVAERTAQFLARAHLVPIPEAGHNPFWEAPDAFFAAVHTFLAEGVPAS